MVLKLKSQLTVFVPDIHAPHEDPRAIDTVLEFIEYLEPELKHLIFLGDGADFYQVSSFDKNPLRVTTLQKDINQAKCIYGRFRAAAPKAEAKKVEGNHEYRMRRWLAKNQEVSQLECLETQNLLGLPDMDIAWYPQEDVLEHHGFIVTHGTMVRRDAGMSAKAELEKWGRSGISGHTHRLGAYWKSNYAGDSVWYEGGCLCDLRPEYMVGAPNWQHGISIGDFDEDTGQFTIHQLRIDRSYNILHHGKRFTGIAA